MTQKEIRLMSCKCKDVSIEAYYAGHEDEDISDFIDNMYGGTCTCTDYNPLSPTLKIEALLIDKEK